MNIKIFGHRREASDTEAPTIGTLSLGAIGEITVVLDWTAATDNEAVTNYEIYKGGILLETIGNLLTYTATGLTAGTAYAFKIKAKDAEGNLSAFSNEVSPTTLNVELFGQDNAASITTEVDATTGWVETSANVSSDAGESHSGSRSIKGNVGTAGSGKRFGYQLTVEDGATYDFTIWAKRGSSNTDSKIEGWWGVTVSPVISIVDQTWAEHTFSVVASGTTMTMHFYPNRGTSSVNDHCYIDDISVRKQ